MSLGMIFSTVFEIALVVFTVWAVFHENKFIALEDRICAFVRRRSFKVIRGSKTLRTTAPSTLRQAQ